MEIIKGNQSEMKNTLYEMKSILGGINRVDEKEDRTTNAEEGEVKVTQSEWQEKRSQEYNSNLRNVQNKIKCKNICVIEVPEGEDGEQEVEKLFENRTEIQE